MADIKTAVQSWSFQKGWGQVKQKDLERVKVKIMTALHIISAPSWYARLGGKVEPKETERIAIEKVFKKYGITDIWGNKKTSLKNQNANTNEHFNPHSPAGANSTGYCAGGNKKRDSQ